MMEKEIKFKKEFKIRPVHEFIKNDKKLINVPVVTVVKSSDAPQEDVKIKSIKDKIKLINKPDNEQIKYNYSSSSSSSDSDEKILNKDLGLSFLDDSDRKNEILLLKKEIVKIKKRIDNPDAEDSDKEETNKIESALEKHRSKFLHLKKGRTDVKEKIDALNVFKQKLKLNKNDRKSWMSYKLMFHIDSQKAYSINESIEKEMKFFYHDPKFK
jgi:hypothetical protein